MACSIHADLLVLLSDIEGLYTADPRKDPEARLIPVVEKGHPRDRGGWLAARAPAWAPAGMATKLRAAKVVTAAGCDMIITNGERP